ncbi:unnamed protein product, partial [Scytosiphon promiscuus]
GQTTRFLKNAFLLGLQYRSRERPMVDNRFALPGLLARPRLPAVSVVGSCEGMAGDAAPSERERVDGRSEDVRMAYKSVVHKSVDVCILRCVIGVYREGTICSLLVAGLENARRTISHDSAQSGREGCLTRPQKTALSRRRLGAIGCRRTRCVTVKCDIVR